jgi:hypothetical protein
MQRAVERTEGRREFLTFDLCVLQNVSFFPAMFQYFAKISFLFFVINKGAKQTIRFAKRTPFSHVSRNRNQPVRQKIFVW